MVNGMRNIRARHPIFENWPTLCMLWKEPTSKKPLGNLEEL
jgi:hypothetical protein